MAQLLWIAAGGAVGAVARHGFGIWAVQHLGERFPWGTFLVNASGSFVLGLLVELFLRTDVLPPGPRLMLTTGMLGALTTFSTFSVQSVRLIERGDHGLAAANIVGQLVVGLGLAWLGVLLARQIS